MNGAPSTALSGLAMLIGRFIIVFPLIPNGLRKLGHFDQLAAAIGGTPQLIDGRPFPGVEPLFYFPWPALFLGASVLMDIVGSLLVIFGVRTRAVALLLTGYCLLAIAIYHYDISDAENVRSLLRNTPLVGGLLFIAGAGGGRWSLEQWWGHHRRPGLA